MNYTFFAQTDTGRVRENNEDAVAFDAATNLCVLADGMGGYNAGEIASGMATAYIKSELSKWLSDAGPQAQAGQVRHAIETCVIDANRSICHASASNTHYAGMGTTLVMGVFKEDRFFLGHVGDSRCYLFRDGALLQITKDHSFLQEQIDAGFLTAQQAARSANRNLVTRALGVEVDVLLTLNEYQVAPGDLYLMCSDGLSDMLDDSVIAGALKSGSSLEKMAGQLISLANENGGRDNITVLLVQAAGMPQNRGFISRLLGK